MLLAAMVLLPASLHAQQTTQSELERSRQRLEQIKQQRDSLERQSQRMAGQITDVSVRMRNLERQRDLTSQAVHAIEQKIGSLGTKLEGSASALALAEDNLADRRAILLRRLTDIYKRGPLYTFQVLLTAESFGDLLARYKYLYLSSRQDRYDLSEFQKLTQRVRVERNDLLGLRSEYDRTRVDREVELQNYARLAEERQAQLRELERNSARTKQRITALAVPDGAHMGEIELLRGPQMVDELKEMIINKRAKEVDIVVTFEPPWQPSEELKEMMGMG